MIIGARIVCSMQIIALHHDDQWLKGRVNVSERRLFACDRIHVNVLSLMLEARGEVEK